MKVIIAKGNFKIYLDDADYGRLSQYKWKAQKLGRQYYAYRDVSLGRHHHYRRIYMHRDILGCAPGDKIKIDHEDHNGLNNQRSNIRIATLSQNGANRLKQLGRCSSVYKGVCYHKRDKKWQAMVMVDKKWQYIGQFNSEIEAAIAYNAAAVRRFGEFAKVNNVHQSSSLT